jgi:glycosidase
MLKKKKSIIFLPFLILLGLFHPLQSQSTSSPPLWARQAIWYQIYPERFWNGDSANDPHRNDVLEGWPYEASANWQIHPWISDWYQLATWEREISEDYYTNAGARRYGGDLQGVLDRLDYLTELGITAVYFNPLFESPSHHKYDTKLYHHIDDNFGPNPSKDNMIWEREDPADPTSWHWSTADSLFLKLIKECHNRNIRVIIDGVFNHVGYTFWAFQDVMHHQQESLYKDWFIIRAWDNPETDINEFDYAGWNGVRELPEIREDDNGLAEGYRNHIHAIVKRWMDPDGNGDPSDGIDGWRLDVAEKVDIKFWRIFHRWVKEINPDAYLVGEIWWEDWPRNKMYNAAPWLQGDVFDGVMNYRVGRALKQFIIDQKQSISGQSFADSIRQIMSDYTAPYFMSCQNLISSHDVERLASQIVNPDRWIDHGGNPAQDMNFKVRKPDEKESGRQRLFVALQLTLPGAPMIYYGDEAGMWGGDDPDCRKPMIWPELTYEDEAAHPFEKLRPSDAVVFDQEMFQWYQLLIRIRKNYPQLSLGSINFITDLPSEKVLVFDRNYKDQNLRIVVNNQHNEFQARFKTSGTEGLAVDVLTGEKFAYDNGEILMLLQPYQLLILDMTGK